MADKTDYRIEEFPNLGVKELVIETATCSSTNTVPITLADYGINRVLDVYAVVHTTDGSVMVQDSVTTALSSGIFTITIPAGNDSKKRVIIVRGE